MAAAPQYSQSGAIAALNALLALLNGSPAGYVKIFTGSPPANTEAGDSGTLLSTMVLSETAFPTAVTNASPRGAKATANAIEADTNAANNGTAGYFRAYSGANVCIVQGNCGTSAADMILNTTSIAAGSTVSCSAWTVTLPNGG